MHLFVILPLAAVILGAWMTVERSLRADVARCLAGEPPRDGIPHHGVLFLHACALLLSFGAWIGMTYVCISCGLQNGVVIFGIANLITNILIVGTLLALRRLERGYDPMLNYDGRKEVACVTATNPPPVSSRGDDDHDAESGKNPVIA